MAKRVETEPYVKWKVCINATLAARVEMVNWDPVHSKPRYGSRRELIEALLSEWLAKQAQAGVPANG